MKQIQPLDDAYFSNSLRSWSQETSAKAKPEREPLADENLGQGQRVGRLKGVKLRLNKLLKPATDEPPYGLGVVMRKWLVTISHAAV